MLTNVENVKLLLQIHMSASISLHLSATYIGCVVLTTVITWRRHAWLVPRVTRCATSILKTALHLLTTDSYKLTTTVYYTLDEFISLAVVVNTSTKILINTVIMLLTTITSSVRVLQMSSVIVDVSRAPRHWCIYRVQSAVPFSAEKNCPRKWKTGKQQFRRQKHQNASDRILNVQKIGGNTPKPSPLGLWPQTRGKGKGGNGQDRKEGKVKGRKEMDGRRSIDFVPPPWRNLGYATTSGPYPQSVVVKSKW